MVVFFNETATTEIYTLSLHDALPISTRGSLSVAENRWTKIGGPTSRLPRDPGVSHALRWISTRYTRTGAWYQGTGARDRKSTRLNSSHANISYAVFCLKNTKPIPTTS